MANKSNKPPKSSSSSPTPGRGNPPDNKKTQNSSGGPGSAGLPLDDLAYDVISLLHEKSKGLAVLEEYLEDAGENEEVRSIFEKIFEQDQRAVEQLEQALRAVISGSDAGEEEEAA